MELENIITLEGAPLPERQSGRGRRYVRSLEYELIAGLVRQQFSAGEEAHYPLLLSIPLDARIPGLMKEYGLKRMHRLVRLILQEFIYSIPLPKSQKLSDTKISVCACDLILAAHEDQLGLEDLILFFERAKKGKYGSFRKAPLTHFSIMEKLQQYRGERHRAYMQIREQKEQELKALGPAVRTASEPTAIKHLFEGGAGSVIPLKKIS